jgi:hypothetical protein
MIGSGMMTQVLEAQYRGAHRVWLRFDDGLDAEVDLSSELDGEVFEPLRDPKYFSCFAVDETLTWPNGADFAPEFLHAKAGDTEPRSSPPLS